MKSSYQNRLSEIRQLRAEIEILTGDDKVKAEELKMIYRMQKDRDKAEEYLHNAAIRMNHPELPFTTQGFTPMLNPQTREVPPCRGSVLKRLFKMLKLAVVLLMLFISAQSFSQDVIILPVDTASMTYIKIQRPVILPYSSAIGVTTMPGTTGAGIRLDQTIKKIRIYESLSYNNYYLPCGGSIKNNLRFSLGYVHPVHYWGDGVYSSISIGAVAMFYGERNLQDYPINERVFRAISFEVGAGAYLGRYYLGIRSDLIKWDHVIDFCYSFNKPRRYEK